MTPFRMRRFYTRRLPIAREIDVEDRDTLLGMLAEGLGTFFLMFVIV